MVKYQVRDNNVLCVGGKEIDFKHNILTVLNFGEIIVVHIYNDFDKQGHINVAEEPINNVYAVNSEGKIIWNIKDLLVADTRYPNSYKDALYTQIKKLDDNTVIATDFSGSQPIIDVLEKKVIRYSCTR